MTATGSAQVFMTPTLTARSRRVLAVVSGRQLRAETAGESHQKRGYEALAAASGVEEQWAPGLVIVAVVHGVR